MRVHLRLRPRVAAQGAASQAAECQQCRAHLAVSSPSADPLRLPGAPHPAPGSRSTSCRSPSPSQRLQSGRTVASGHMGSHPLRDPEATAPHTAGRTRLLRADFQPPLGPWGRSASPHTSTRRPRADQRSRGQKGPSSLSTTLLPQASAHPARAGPLQLPIGWQKETGPSRSVPTRAASTRRAGASPATALQGAAVRRAVR